MLPTVPPKCNVVLSLFAHDIEKKGITPILLMSIAEALLRMITCKRNMCHAPFLGNYLIELCV